MAIAVSAAAWGQAFNAVLLILFLAGSIDPSVLALWLLALTLLMLRAFTFLKRVQHRMIHSIPRRAIDRAGNHSVVFRSEEHTSELQSLMRISYAVFCLKKKKQHKQ